MINSVLGLVSFWKDDSPIELRWSKKKDELAGPAKPEEQKPKAPQSVLISSAPVQYQECMNGADRKGNGNGRIDNPDEAVTAAECFYKKNKNKIEDNLKLLKMLENTNFTGKNLKSELADTEVDNQLGLLSSRDKDTRKKALLTLGYLAGASFVSTQAKEKMIEPLRQVLRDRGYLPSNEIALAFVNLVRSDLPAATKERIGQLIVSLMKSKNETIWHGGVGIACEVIASPQISQGYRAGLLGQALDRAPGYAVVPVINYLANLKFADAYITYVQVKGKESAKNTMSETDFETIVVDPLLSSLKGGKIKYSVMLSRIIYSGNYSDRLNQKMAVPLATAIMKTHFKADECSGDRFLDDRYAGMLEKTQKYLSGRLRQRVSGITEKCDRSIINHGAFDVIKDMAGETGRKQD